MNRWEGASYITLAVIQAIATQLAIEIGAGRVPMPASWQWLMPVASAGLVTLSMLLPRAGGGGRRWRDMSATERDYLLRSAISSLALAGIEVDRDKAERILDLVEREPVISLDAEADR